MPYQSDAQRKFMHMKHPAIAKRWDAEAKTYRTGTPVAHKNMTLDPTGYINREVNKGRQKPSTKRSGLAKMSLERAAQRRLATKSKKKNQHPVRKV